MSEQKAKADAAAKEKADVAAEAKTAAAEKKTAADEATAAKKAADQATKDAAELAAWRLTPVGRYVEEHLTILQDRTGGRRAPSE